MLYLLALAATPAAAEPFVPRSEYVWQALNAADAAETLSCLHRGVCRELNPLFGPYPSDAKLIGGKVAEGILHLLISHALRDKPNQERIFETLTIAVQGGVVAANLRVTF
jgi:hypothetical protein